MKKVFRFHKGYAAVALLLLLVEVAIAMYVTDGFVRPYVGDFLVVMLIYTTLKSFLRIPSAPLAVGVLLFAFAVEISQYFHLIDWFGWRDNRLAQVVMGNSFAWSDLLAYTLGIAVVLLIETRREEH